MVASTLRDGDVERLRRRTPDGLTIQALYTAAEAPPAPPLSRPAHDADRPWDIRTATAHPDPTHANHEILDDLEGGAASVLVRDRPERPPGRRHRLGRRLARVLDGVILELAPVGLDAGLLGTRGGRLAGRGRQVLAGAKLLFNLDPLSAFAAAGASPGPDRGAPDRGGEHRRRLEPTYPKASLFLASGRVAHEAGGGAAIELGVAAASALAYAKALARAGLGIERRSVRSTWAYC